MEKLKKILGFLNFTALLKDYKYPFKINNYSNYKPLPKLLFTIKNGIIKSNDTRSKFPISYADKFNNSLTCINDGLKNFDFFEENDKLLFCPKGNLNIKFILINHDNINAAREIFVEQSYNFILNDDYIVVDIGANVGVSALFFAENPRVKKIVCYEPFPETAEIFKDNIMSNPRYSHKIVLNVSGLSNIENRETVPKPPKGFMGATTSSDIISRFYKGENELIEIDVKKASTEISSQINHYPNLKVLLKIDCEGAEYDIFEDLDIHNVLDRVDIVVAEWHFKGSQPIVNILSKNNFRCILIDKNIVDFPMGMIYAFK